MEYPKFITYKSGFKYQLTKPYIGYIGIRGFHVETKFITLFKNGVIKIKDGYAWDGASGPAVDTETIKRASLVHDALYQLIRGKQLHRIFKVDADEVFRTICKEDGMSRIRMWYTFLAIRKLGGAFGLKPKKEQVSPKGRDKQSTNN